VLEILQRIARGENRVDELVKPKDFSHGRTEIPMRFEIEVEVGGRRYDYGVAFEYPPGFKWVRVLDEKLTVDGNTVYARELADVHPSKRGSRQGLSFQLDWHHVALPIVQEQSFSDPLAVFKRWLARAMILRPIPRLISGRSSQQSMELDPTASNLGEWFSAITSDVLAAYADVAKYLKDVMPDLKQITNTPTNDGYKSLFVEFSNQIGATRIPFEDLSDGEKCFMICSLVMASNKHYGPWLCYWDEPDCYLAPDEVGHMVMALRQVFEASGQFIMTSHHPEAILRFSDENTFLLHRRSHIEPVTVHSLESLHIQGDLASSISRGDVYDYE
jgi:hypothetical protein